MKIELVIIVILIVLLLGQLLKIKTNIRIFNYISIVLLVVIFLWSYFVSRNLSGGVAWPWYLFLIIYGTPVLFSFIVTNLIEYIKMHKQKLL